MKKFEHVAGNQSSFNKRWNAELIKTLQHLSNIQMEGQPGAKSETIRLTSPDPEDTDVIDFKITVEVNVYKKGEEPNEEV